MANNFQKIIEQLKPETLKPVYLIHGAEPYFVDQFVQKVIDIAIPDFEKGFNEYILYGKDISLGDVINYARKFPMMAEKQLVVVKEAHLLSDLNNKDSLSLLESYFKNPLPSTILLLSFGKAQDERKTWVKAANTKGEMHNFKKMYDSELPDFIMAFCNQKNLKINPKAVQLIAEHIGNNLQAIHNEIEKIRVNLTEGQTIDAEVIEKFVGISKDFNVFELQKAILDKNVQKCYQIVTYFASNPKDNPIQPNIIVLYNFFSKILFAHGSKSLNDQELARAIGVNPYFLKDYKRGTQVYPISHLMRIIHVLREVDQRSKGIGMGSLTEKDLYKDLIFNILH
jgi:DNA polymerase III subunit delta